MDPPKSPTVECRCNEGVLQAKIHGDRDVFVQEGSDINLTCTALSTPEQPESVKWRHNNLDLHRSTRGGIAIVTEKRRRTSVLLMYRSGEICHIWRINPSRRETLSNCVFRAVASDTGNYSCQPSNAEADMVQVHVLQGTGGAARIMTTHFHLSNMTLGFTTMRNAIQTSCSKRRNIWVKFLLLFFLITKVKIFHKVHSLQWNVDVVNVRRTHNDKTVI